MTEKRASLVRSALADSTVGVLIFVDRFCATDRCIVRSELDLGDCGLEVLREEDLDGAGEFDAVLWLKTAFGWQCGGQKNAW